MRTTSLDDLLQTLPGYDPEWAGAVRQSPEGEGGPIQAAARSTRLPESEVVRAAARALGMPFLENVDEKTLSWDLVQDIPIAWLRTNLMVPVQGEGDAVLAVHADPSRGQALQDLRIMLAPRPVTPVLATSREVLAAINRVFGEAGGDTGEFMQDFEADMDEALFSELEEMSSQDLLDESSDAPIIRLVNHILSQAVKNEASDVHFEPFHDTLQVRFRMDGVLYTVFTLPRKLHAAVISRIKIMARLDIAEKRLPQDGRMEVKLGNRLVDLRVSLLPTAFGERAVLRLLEKTARLLDIDELGMSQDHLVQTRKLLGLSHGIILVTGPTGSGKTTTLYSALSHINSPDKNILTIEDPIEYQLEGIGQMQVNPKIGLTFAGGLRSIVRQDPDVILIGEIRDLETAEIAIQAALTGHLVLSTLHTNDAASAVTRLIKMGIEPFLISSAVRAIVAQRLVRLVCPVCREHFTPPSRSEIEHELHVFATGENITKPVGCEKCYQTGYKGRTAIFEYLPMNEKLQDFILKTSDANQIRQLAIAQGMRTLREDGMDKIQQGLTTSDEVLKATLI